jgi:hypothetical protein
MIWLSLSEGSGDVSLEEIQDELQNTAPARSLMHRFAGLSERCHTSLRESCRGLHQSKTHATESLLVDSHAENLQNLLFGSPFGVHISVT